MSSRNEDNKVERWEEEKLLESMKKSALAIEEKKYLHVEHD